jgi:hypothetical protein
MPQLKRVDSSSKEGRLALALQAYKSGSFTSIRSAAKTYDIAETTLRARLKGRPAKHESRSVNHKLTETEESTLVKWILSMSERGLPLRTSAIRQMADLLLQKRLPTDNAQTRQVGQRWVYNFIQRHDSIQSRYNRKYDYQRAKCEDPTIIRDWFRLVQNTIAKYRILEEDIYNFDETGF